MNPTAIIDMAKKKTAPKGSPKPARKPLIAQVRGSEEFRAWLEEMAEMDGRSVAGFIDRAVRVYAEQLGSKKPAPKR